VTKADENLQTIDHIVVLMMENRSFDHMLGFLTIDHVRDDVEGAEPGDADRWSTTASVSRARAWPCRTS
jgi:phospholipase C